MSPCKKCKRFVDQPREKCMHCEVEKLEQENKKLLECVEKFRKISKLTYMGQASGWWFDNMRDIRAATGRALKDLKGR